MELAVGPCRQLGAFWIETPLLKWGIFVRKFMLSVKKPRAIMPAIEYTRKLKESGLTPRVLMSLAGLAAVYIPVFREENAEADEKTVWIPRYRVMVCKDEDKRYF